MRKDPKQGIDAGLLKYAEMVIDNEVVNDFKRMSRAEDLSITVLNGGQSPEYGNHETVAWDSDDKEREDSSSIQPVIRDVGSMNQYVQAERWHDVQRLVEAANLTDEELNVIKFVDLEDMSVRQYSDKHNVTVARVHRILSSAHHKLSAQDLPLSVTDELAFRTASKYGCSTMDIEGSKLFGTCVAARTELFSKLFDMGMTISWISARFSISEDRVSAAINRSVIQESRQVYVG
jgi:DNA-directed RNA polymerase specialized sigma24 family protein